MADSDAPITVLYVDDEPGFVDVASEFLAREVDRIEVVPETNPRGALRTLVDTEIDCIVSDYRMPELDGLELLTRVRERHPEIPFILFTGRGTEEIASEAISAGVTDYLQKGGGTDQYAILANRIVNAVEQYRAERRTARRRRINRLINDVNQALVRSSSTEAIETRTCELIDESETFEFGVIARRHVDSGEPRVRTGPAIDRDRIDGDGIGPPEDDPPSTLADRALQTGSVVVETDVDGEESDPLRRVAEAEDCDAVAAIPLEYEDRSYGLLAVYAESPDRFVDGDLLVELGTDVEQALRRIEIREELRETKARYQKVFDQSNDAIMVVDIRGEEFLDANRAACELLGYDREELLDLHPEDIHPNDLDRVREEFLSQVLEEGRGWTDELTCIAKDGEEIPTEISGAVLEFEEEDEPTRMVAILRDVSTREAQKRQLQREVERLDEFAQVVSHDLQSPLNVASGRLDLAREERNWDHLDDVARALERMETMIEDILTLAREGQTVEEAKPIPLGDLCERCWENLDTTDATMVVETSRTIVADRDRLRQLLENLFGNAVEHGSTSPHPSAEDALEHGESEVTIRVGDLPDGFYVEDDGPGIPPEDRDDVFETGYSTSEEGTGFGLSIVEQIVEAHDWTVSVTEGTDGGARFEITGVEMAG